MISAANVVGDPSYALVRVLIAMPHVRLRNAIASALEWTHDTGTRETRVAGLPRRGATSNGLTPSDGVRPAQYNRTPAQTGSVHTQVCMCMPRAYWNFEPFVARFHPCGVVLGGLCCWPLRLRARRPAWSRR